MMDVYIYSGILTAGSIFVLNSFTVCVDVGECENETASETIWFWVIVGFWAITNILIFSTAVRFVACLLRLSGDMFNDPPLPPCFRVNPRSLLYLQQS